MKFTDRDLEMLANAVEMQYDASRGKTKIELGELHRKVLGEVIYRWRSRAEALKPETDPVLSNSDLVLD